MPVRSREAKDFVRAWHRHHPPPAGQIFAVGAADETGILPAVAIVGRPVARHLDDGATLEVTRTASDGTRNTNSQQKVTNLSRFSITCPFHGNAQWRHIRDTSPSEWADVVEFDAAIRQGNARANASGSKLLGEAFLHRSRVPLSEAPIDHVTAAERAALQPELGDADVLENGVEDGCSPWACRGDADALTQDDFGLAT
ncbi:XF1762 family protein [Streptomyces ardesiacus]|uniref:XF1762 family protein n=1 Tax=Streptomyces ardesiacus TaxID=285564 RepID=UPI00351C22A8